MIKNTSLSISQRLAGWHSPAERAPISVHYTNTAKQYVVQKPVTEF